MRRLLVLLVAGFAVGLASVVGMGAEATATALPEIALPQPAAVSATPPQPASSRRQRVRGFQSREVTEQQVGQVLWAAQGSALARSVQYAAPGARASRGVTVHVLRGDGVYAYEPSGHKLVRLSDQDRRAEVTPRPRGGRVAPVILLLATEEKRRASAASAVADLKEVSFDAGKAQEAAAALGLATVLERGMNVQGAVKALGLPASTRLLYGLSIGYALVPSALETDPSGWVDVLPPADLTGWSRVPVPPGAALGRQQWHVDTAAKVLICDGDGGHDMLLCDREFGDALFHAEFRYTREEGKGGYNSGIYVRNSADGAIWHQAQIGDASGGYLFGETGTADGGKRFFTVEVKNGEVKPAGEWNTVEITARGNVLTLWVNGAVTCQINDCGTPAGRVGVEGEGYRIEFRNLKVKELGPRPGG